MTRVLICTNAGQNPVNQVGDQAASKTPPIHVTDVGNLDIMPRLASTKKQFATNVEKLVTYRGSACRSKQKKPQKPVNNVLDDATDEYQLLNITSPGKATLWNVSVDIEGITVSMQLDTARSLKVW